MTPASAPTGLRSVTDRRGAHGALRRRDLDVLAWLGEQYGARADHLEQLLGCGERTVQRMLARLLEAGLVATRRLIVGEPAWVIPTSAGLRVDGQGFAVWQPRLALLAHVAAVNYVRLHVQSRSPTSEWVCERVLARERRDGEHLPDAVVVTGDQKVAIEVELTVKSRARVASILDELAERFHATVYFCTPGSHRQLSELAASGRWPTLDVRALPDRRLGESA
jgi:hypothetical protein